MPAAMDDILPEVSRLLAERAGMAAESFGASGIAHAVRKRMSAAGTASSEDYVRGLSVDSREFQELLEELVVPETWFFRDMLAFRCLARRLDAARALGRTAVRVLSVGCSTGEEVYSLAMAVREAGFEPAQSVILGTDVSQRSLAVAQKGVFTSRSFREGDETSRAFCRRWCESVGESWQVHDELRARVEFRWANLGQPDFLVGVPPFQVIFCRNVLIYFHTEARRAAVRHLGRLLAPDGLLCSAPAEARIFIDAGFCSLGSECPFAFRRQDERMDAPGAAAGARGPEVKRQPLPDVSASRPPVSWRPVLVAASPAGEPGVADARVPSSDGNATQEATSAQAILHAAKQAADDGRLEEADALCGQVLSRDPASAAAHCLRGVIHQAQGGLSQAQRSLEKALYLDPKHYQALVHMMLLAEQRGDQQAAANYRRRAQQAAATEAQ